MAELSVNVSACAAIVNFNSGAMRSEQTCHNYLGDNGSVFDE